LFTERKRNDGMDGELVPLPDDDVFLGTRLCPRPTAVQGAISRLKNGIAAEKRSGRDLTAPCFHNLFTFYSAWTFAFATGVRAIAEPYIDPYEISRLNSTGLLRDKDSDSGGKAKLVWIPPRVKEQMHHYSHYIGDSPDRHSSAEPIYFLDENGKHQVVRPKSLEPYMAQYLPGFPIGVHRRFMFNALIDSGCPPQAVRVWMGHALTGDEPWSRFASFSYAAHRLVLSKYLLPILAYLGFEPVSGARE